MNPKRRKTEGQLKKGIGIAFSDEDLKVIDDAWMPGHGGIFEGRFDSRTSFINYCTKTVIQIASHKRETLENLIDILDTFESNHELQTKVITILKQLVPKSD